MKCLLALAVLGLSASAKAAHVAPLTPEEEKAAFILPPDFAINHDHSLHGARKQA